LAQADQITIINQILNLAGNGYQFVIPIGFPAAGKSLFLSSLFHFAERKLHKEKWVLVDAKGDSFSAGKFSVETMIAALDDIGAYIPTKTGTLDLIGKTFKPKCGRNLPDLNLAFIDLSGEDIQRIRIPNGGAFSNAIQGIFRALNSVNTTKPIFCLITPYKSDEKENRKEDDLYRNFMNYNYLMGNLYSRATFIILVTQWDRNENKQLTVEEYIRINRPNLYNLQGNGVARILYHEYSIGNVKDALENDENGNEKPSIYIEEINEEYPANFWKKLYLLSTGRSLEPFSWWNKIFGRRF
jgi:hypothetical protein